MSVAAYVIAAVVFAIAALGVTLGALGAVELVALGLFVFTLAHVLPR